MRELLAVVRGILDLPRAIVVIEGALDRKTLDETLKKVSRGALGRASTLSRAEVVGRLADLFHKDDNTATSLMRDLDKGAHKERHIVASIEEAAVDERLRTYRALDFRRERARLVWALVRDGREAHRKAAAWVLDEAFAALAEKEQVDAAVAAPGAKSDEVVQALHQRLTSYEDAIQDQQKRLQQEVGHKEGVERERAELVARLGAREKALREEEQTRRNIAAELQKARDQIHRLEEERKELDPDRQAAIVEENLRLKERVRTLERAADRAGRLAELEGELSEQQASHKESLAAAAAARDALDEQLRLLQARERAALHRVDDLREQLKEARQQLARGSQVAAPPPSAANRIGVFVDEANLSASARRDLGSRLDYRALLEALVGDRKRSCAIAFVVDAPETSREKHDAFTTSLRGQGWELREKRAKVRHDGSRKADWDMGLAMEILDHIDDLDVVVIGSGDGDFIPLIKRLKRLGKRVEVAAFRASTDEAIMGVVDAFVGLDGRFRLNA